MSLFNWEDRYSVSVELFNQQHKELIRIMNDLYESMQRNTPLAEGSVVERLISYTQTHFSAEEDLMREQNFPGLSVHKDEHDRLTAKVKEFQSRVGGNEKRLNVDMLIFLKNWLGGHILGLDMMYSGFFKERKVY